MLAATRGYKGERSEVNFLSPHCEVRCSSVTVYILVDGVVLERNWEVGEGLHFFTVSDGYSATI